MHRMQKELQTHRRIMRRNNKPQMQNLQQRESLHLLLLLRQILLGQQWNLRRKEPQLCLNQHANR